MTRRSAPLRIAKSVWAFADAVITRTWFIFVMLDVALAFDLVLRVI